MLSNGRELTYCSLRMTRRKKWKCGYVDNPERLGAEYSRVAVYDGHAIVRSTHLTYTVISYEELPTHNYLSGHAYMSLNRGML